MSDTTNSTEGAGSNAGALPHPDPKLLRPHLIGKHHLIPLHKPDARKNNRSVGKAPLGRNWGARKYSEQEILTWMLRGHNVGVCLRDDQLVIDVDPRNFEGRDRLAELCAKFGFKPDDYPCVYSGGGGRHIYMSKSPLLHIRGTLEDFPGIEFKTEGTQLVAGGSVHPNTKNHYRAEDPFNDFLKPLEAPAALLQALARPETCSDGTSPAILSPERVGEFLAVIDPVKYRKYDDWLHLMMACHQASGGTAVEEFVAWAISDPEFAAHETKNREKWDMLDCEKPNGIKAGTLFKAVCDAGRSDLVAEMHRQHASEDFPELPGEISSDSSRKRFREMSFDDLSAMEAPKWLVKDLIPDGGLAVVYGQPKSCKTFWTLDMALSVASGRPFHGLETRHGRVTYVAAEGGPARLHERALAWARTYGANPDRAVKWLIAESIDLTDGSDVAEFIKALDGPRDLVVIDMTTKTQELDAVPDPRWLLMEQLESIAKKRAEHQEVVAQHRRLQTFLKLEAEAQANVDALKQRDAQKLAEQLVNPTGLHVSVDHCEQSAAEFELSRARREADVAHACEPAVIARQADSSRQIAALEQQVPMMVADIMLEDAHSLVAEINAEAKRLRAKYARLWGLRRHVGETPAIRKRLEILPLPIHPDNVAPDLGELITAAERWRGYAARLAADPDAEFKE